jgi:hypothetical protein
MTPTLNGGAHIILVAWFKDKEPDQLWMDWIKPTAPNTTSFVT